MGGKFSPQRIASGQGALLMGLFLMVACLPATMPMPEATPTSESVPFWNISEAERERCIAQAVAQTDASRWGSWVAIETFVDSMRIEAVQGVPCDVTRCRPGMIGFPCGGTSAYATVVRRAGECRLDPPRVEYARMFDGDVMCPTPTAPANLPVTVAIATVMARPPPTETPVPPTETPVLPTAAPGLTSTPAFWPTGMPPPTPGPTAVWLSGTWDKAECLRRGATWADRWVFGGPSCQGYPTADGGRVCSDGSECQAGWCDANLPVEAAEELLQRPGAEPLLMTGTCLPETRETFCGGYARVEGGRLTIIETICM
jgi:hypothetical protein